VKEELSNIDISLKTFNREYNYFIYKIVCLTEALLMLGAYQNEEEIQSLIPILVGLLDGTNDFTSPEEEVLHKN
jgi:hypothetical protein